MTIFSRYYDANGKLHETTMEQLDELLKNENNKIQIANLIYHRYYERYLKIFDYDDDNSKEYHHCDGNKTRRSTFKMEYKNGFAIMVNCCLVIESLASFYTGTNFITTKGDDAYNLIFKKASEYGNSLTVFENNNIYKHIRNGLLHQGETYGGFKIRRNGPLLEDNVINATLFFDELKRFLKSYCTDLSSETAKWDDDLWRKCRDKLGCIINNSRMQK